VRVVLSGAEVVLAYLGVVVLACELEGIVDGAVTLSRDILAEGTECVVIDDVAVGVDELAGRA